ncbi:MAG: hypothetical protein IH614_11870 [Desulfuromonadales bacterium]|nr:hypothetical protein [Desulfuromonadales bacterium]
MQIAPPAESLLNQPPMELMELFGRMRSLADAHGFSGVLPAVWQCSDESQMIKKALFGYVFNCPTFNLGRVGALLDPTRLGPAAHHGRDLVILGGSHLGAREEAGIGMVERVHGPVAPCCGKLRQILWDYLLAYRRAAALITLFREEDEPRIEIPYKYLFRKSPGDTPRIQLLLPRLTEGEELRDGSRGKIYRLAPAMRHRHADILSQLGREPQPIGPLLAAESFVFERRLDPDTYDPLKMIEFSVFDFLPEIVASAHPHRRLADINTWRQFHRLAAYLTDSFDSGERNILVVAGLTIDHSIRRNLFQPQFGFLMKQGKSLQGTYFSPPELVELLCTQEVYRPKCSFLDYAAGVNS